MTTAENLVGSVALGEFRLDRVAHQDASLWVYRATSTVDGGAYAIAVAPGVAVETSASALAEAVTRASQHAIGQRGLSALLSARTLEVGGAGRVAVARRGEPGVPITEQLGGHRPLTEIVKELGPVASALETLHDQGVSHGAVSPWTVVYRDGRIVLDWFGLSMVSEVASAARGARALLAEAFRPPEVSGASLPGPYSDTWSLAKVALVLLVGDDDARREVPDIGLAPAVEDAFRLALSQSPASRPTPAAFLAALDRASRAPEPRASSRTAPAGGPGAPGAPAPTPAPDGRAIPLPPRATPDDRDAPPPSMPPPSLSPAGRGTKTLAIGIAATLGVLMLVTGGALAWSLWGKSGSTPPVATAPTTTATPTTTPTGPVLPTAPTTSTVSPTGTPNLTVTLKTGPATYPDDTTALLPVLPDAAVRGTRDALVTLVVAGSFTCELTAKELAVIPPLEAHFASDLRIVFLQAGNLADPSEDAIALAAEAVREKVGLQGFWKLAELTAGTKPDGGRLEELGMKAGAPAGTVTTAIGSKAGAARLARDTEIAARLGVKGTPTLFVNGVRLDGFRSYTTLVAILDEERSRARKLLTGGVPREKVYAARVLANITTSEGEKRYGK